MQVGDVVYLKSGSRPMTVTAVDGTTHTCDWDGGSKQFPEAALTIIDPAPALAHAARKEAERLVKIG